MKTAAKTTKWSLRLKIQWDEAFVTDMRAKICKEKAEDAVKDFCKMIVESGFAVTSEDVKNIVVRRLK